MKIEKCPFTELHGECECYLSDRGCNGMFYVYCGGCEYRTPDFANETEVIAMHNAVARDHADGEKRRRKEST